MFLGYLLTFLIIYFLEVTLDLITKLWSHIFPLLIIYRKLENNKFYVIMCLLLCFIWYRLKWYLSYAN